MAPRSARAELRRCRRALGERAHGPGARRGDLVRVEIDRVLLVLSRAIAADGDRAAYSPALGAAPRDGLDLGLRPARQLLPAGALAQQWSRNVRGSS